MGKILDGFINPATIAIIGASNDLKKPGGRIVKNILSQGYAGRLFLINPKSTRVQDLPALPSIKDLPEPPDLAYIAIPARFVAPAVTELAELGVMRVIVLSAGFGEVSDKGRAAEKRLAEIADQAGMVLIGPNCLGVMSPVHAGKFAGLLPRMSPTGLDFISGSGATVDTLIEPAVRRGLNFRTFFTVGNSAQMGVSDVLALYDRDSGPEDAAGIMLYLEKVGEPAKLLDHARSLAGKGRLLMAIKAGVTDDGKRAAASHTGAMVASDTAVQALFDKAGLIRLSSKIDMIDLAAAATLAKGRYDGRRVCIVTDSGGPGVMAADEFNRQGLELPRLKPDTRKQLAELLPLGAGVNNPVDMLPTRTPDLTAKTLEILAREEADNLDYLVIHFGDPGFEGNWPLYQVVIKAMDTAPTPIFPCFATSISSRESLKKFRAAGKCYFEDEVSLARAVGRMVNRPRVFPPTPDPVGYDRDLVIEAFRGATGVASGELINRALRAAGIPLPREVRLTSAGELAGLETTLPGPWVMKVIGPLHKTDLGGVVVGVDPDQAEAVFNRLMKIDGAEGVLVQETAVGQEVIMGLSREGEFGHLVAFGLGGVLAEALGDVKFGLAPLSGDEADRVVRSIRALPILRGYRGQPGMDLDRLGDLLTRVSLLGRDVPTIKELDINPVKGSGDKLLAVDVRIILD